MRIFVSFYKINWWVLWIARWRNTRYDHCSIVYVHEGESRLLHCCKYADAKFVSERAYNKTHSPVACVYIGETTASPEELEAVIEEPLRFQPFHIAWWYFVTRWFSDWTPRGCCTIICCRMLRACGLDIDNYVVPTDLWKELRDANCFYCWTGRRR